MKGLRKVLTFWLISVFLCVAIQGKTLRDTEDGQSDGTGVKSSAKEKMNYAENPELSAAEAMEIINEKNLDEASKDNSAFDKIAIINQKAAKSGHIPKMFEGDIVETELLKEMIENRKRGAASSIKEHIWEVVNGKHEIPYQIREGVSSYRNTILGAMKEWTDKVSCLRFVQRTNQREYIYFQSGSGCSSYVGRIGSGQPITLAKGCNDHGIIIHEIGHALGFFHEQSRKDRDKFLTIHLQNILPRNRHNFDIEKNTDDTAFPNYDYDSIMQYGPKAFTANGLDTITAKNAHKIGQRRGLSAGDVQQAKKLYTACSGVGVVLPCDVSPCQNGGTCTNENNGGFKCSCSSGWTGSKCTKKGNRCLTDNNTSCQYWTGKGYCRHSYVQYMFKNCKRSCCSGNLTNKNSRCQQWADAGFCFGKYQRYMLKYCIASCCRC